MPTPPRTRSPEELLETLEETRLQFIEKMVARASERAYTDDDYVKLVLYRDAIDSVKGAITFASSQGT